MAGMEIRIDSVEGQATPKDTFVSMRVGDYQKQSRFGSAKTYRFPHMEDEHRFARIEVFHRIGHLTVNLDNLPSNEPLEVPVDMVEYKTLPMKLAILSDSVETKTDPKAKQQKAKNKVDAAQKYLAEHHVEEVIADAIREVIHEKPSDPHTFISEQILKHAAKKQAEMLELNVPSNQVIMQDVVDHSAAKPMAPPAVAIVPFRQYYNDHFHSLDNEHLEKLYGKFGSKTEAVAAPKSAAPASPPSVGVLPFRDYYDQHVHQLDGMEKLYSKFPAQPQPAPKKPEAVAATVEVVEFAKRPSVGTWLCSAPKKVKGEEATVKEAPKDSSATKPAVSSLTPFRDYYLEQVRSVPDMEELYAKFPAQPKPAPKPAAAVAAKPEVAFALRPSVGTWLAPAPFKMGQAAAPKVPEKAVEAEAAKLMKATPAPVVELLPFRDYYQAQVHSLPDMEKLYAKFPAQPKPAPKPAAAVAAPAIKFQHRPSVATWLNPVPLKKAAEATSVPPSILDRSRSRIVAMEKEEIVDAVKKEMKQKEEAYQCQIHKKEEEFVCELKKKDEEIARLKALLSK